MRNLVPLCSALAAATLVLTGSPAEASTRYTVSVVASRSAADVGSSITLTGKVSPRARGHRVLVQHLAAGHWTTVRKVTLDRRSRYAAAVKVTSPGDNRYRVVKPKSDGHRKGVSPTVTVVGWRWRSLTSLPTYGVISNAAVAPTGQLGAMTFSPVVRLGSPSGAGGSITYVLGFACSTLDVHVAMTPDSFAAGYGTANLGSVAPGGAVTQIGQIRQLWPGWDPVHVVRGPSVMSHVWGLNLNAQDLIGGGYVGWGAPRVYCRS